MSFFVAQSSTMQTCNDCLEEHSDKLHMCKPSYSAQHPLLQAATLSGSKVCKKDHLQTYQEMNPFVRAEADKISNGARKAINMAKRHARGNQKISNGARKAINTA